MTAPEAVRTTELPLRLLGRGKVRDIYEVNGDRLLLVASDRISAFDVVMEQPIQWKGAVLTQLTAWWLGRLDAAEPHHLLTADPRRIAEAVPALADDPLLADGRAMLVRRAPTIPVECVVRGYLAGSAWREYRESGTLAGEPLPAGLRQGERLPTPIFSPATKAAEGHDENIRFDDVVERLGAETAAHLRGRSLSLYAEAASVAEAAGLILADTKFEFGTLPDGRIILIDEVLTPDSSRYWPRTSHVVGRPQESLDKQPVRDFLEGMVTAGDWDRDPPPPPLPDHVVRSTAQRYLLLFRTITGGDLEGGE